MGCSFSDGCGEWGNRVRVHNFLIPAILQWRARSMNVSHSTGKKRVALHSYGDGKQANEGVVVGMVSGSANAHGWTSVGHYFL